MICDLLKSIVLAIENFKCNLGDISGGSIKKSDEIFSYMDKYKDGFVTVDELEELLAENGVRVNNKEVMNLFEQFDRNADGRITFDEFCSPMGDRCERMF